MRQMKVSKWQLLSFECNLWFLKSNHFKINQFSAQIPFIRWKEAVGVCKVASINRRRTSKALDGKIGFSFITVNSGIQKKNKRNPKTHRSDWNSSLSQKHNFYRVCLIPPPPLKMSALLLFLPDILEKLGFNGPNPRPNFPKFRWEMVK